MQRISLRQNLLSSLSYTPNPPSNPESETLPTISSESAQATAADAPSTAEGADDIDEDDNDDEDAKKKEQEFEYHESHSEARTQENGETAGEVQWPLRNLEELEEIDLYDNRLKSVKGLEGLTALKSVYRSVVLARQLIARYQIPRPVIQSPAPYLATQRPLTKFAIRLSRAGSSLSHPEQAQQDRRRSASYRTGLPRVWWKQNQGELLQIHSEDCVDSFRG